MKLTREPAWKWPLVAMLLILWSVTCIWAGKSSGWREAVAKSERVRFYVNTEMRNIGFCKWVELSDIATDCAGRAALQEGEQ